MTTLIIALVIIALIGGALAMFGFRTETRDRERWLA